jgi:hypothetical protein
MHPPPYAIKAAAVFVADQEARAASPADLLNARQGFALHYLMQQRARLDPCARGILLKAAAAARILESNLERSFGGAAWCLRLLASATCDEVEEREAELIHYMRVLGTGEPKGD